MREGWEYKTFGEVGSFLRGKSIQKADFVENGMPCIHYGQVHTKFGVSVDKHLSEIPLDIYNKSIIASHGDVIIAITSEDLEGSCKSTAWLGNYDIAVSSHAAVYKHTLNPKFIAYYLRSKSFYYEKQKYARGFKVMEIKPTDIEKIPIPVPPLSEQQRIVSELDLLSSIIEKKKAQLKEYDQLAQSIFFDMFGDPVENEKGWESLSIGECCLLKSGNSDANNSSFGSLPYVKVGDMNIVGNETYITTSSKFVDREENKKDIFPIGTTIFPKRGGAILTNKKRITNVEICCDLNVMGVIPNKERLHPLYIYFYFLRIDFSIFGKTGSTIPQINNHNIAPMKIGVPPLSLQQSFASKIEAIERQKALVQQSITETETLFNSRMDYYFN